MRNRENWRPSGVDVADYSWTIGASRNRWLWEFLRRNPCYQAMWESYLRPVDGNEDRLIRSRRARRPNALIRRNPIMSLAQHFGINASAELPPPEDDDGYQWISPIGAGVGMVGTSLVETRLSLKTHEVAFVVRLDMPIALQVKKIKRLADAAARADIESGRMSKRAEPRKRTEHYPRYIRALDLADTGRSPAEIASIMLPNQENSIANNYSASTTISNYIKSAKSLRDGGYRCFAYIDWDK